MSTQVFKYDSAEDYLDPFKQGVPASDKFATEVEAEKVRNLLREENPQYYYNLHHSTRCTVIDTN